MWILSESVLAYFFTAPLIFHLIGIIIHLFVRTPATMGVNGKKDHVPVPMDKLAMAKQMAAKLTAKTATINKSEVSFVITIVINDNFDLSHRWRRRQKVLCEGQEGLLDRASLLNLLQVSWLANL